ncbi:MAG: GntR family transcriptional regulator [Candidatus Dormibacteraeota bacterium]|nr:GntR family transcriptional regulator [Candidatus Dormibacteraeota bacterium]
MATTRQEPPPPTRLAQPSALRIYGPPRHTLADRAYQSIRVAIVNQELQPDRYYSEAWLAGEMGISRTPIHAALLQLEIEGMVQIEAQRGFRLRLISGEEHDEFFEIRLILEANVLRRLCPKADEDVIATLWELCDRQRRAIGEPVLFTDLDEGFHRYLAEAAGLHRTAAIIHSLRGLLWLGTAHRPTSERERAVTEHSAIVEAVAKRNAAAAVDALERHLRGSQQRWRRRETRRLEALSTP